MRFRQKFENYNYSYVYVTAVRWKHNTVTVVTVLYYISISIILYYYIIISIRLYTYCVFQIWAFEKGCPHKFKIFKKACFKHTKTPKCSQFVFEKCHVTLWLTLPRLGIRLSRLDVLKGNVGIKESHELCRKWSYKTEILTLNRSAISGNELHLHLARLTVVLVIMLLSFFRLVKQLLF